MSGRRLTLAVVLVVVLLGAGTAVVLSGSQTKGRSVLRRPSPPVTAAPRGVAAPPSSEATVPASTPQTAPVSTPLTQAPAVHVTGGGEAGIAPSSPAVLKITPTIAAISPSNAGGCSVVAITGSNLSSSVAVTFNRSLAPVVQVQSGAIQVKVPNMGTSPATVAVAVHLSFLTSPSTPADQFTYTGIGTCVAPTVGKTKSGTSH